MNARDIERLEKNSVYSLRLSSDLKEQVIKNYLNELNKILKIKLKNKKLLLLLVDID